MSSIAVLNLKGTLNMNVPFFIALNSNSNQTIDFSDNFVTWDNPLFPSMKYQQVLNLYSILKLVTNSQLQVKLNFVYSSSGGSIPYTLIQVTYCNNSDTNCSKPLSLIGSPSNGQVIIYSGNTTDLVKSKITIINNSQSFFYVSVAVSFVFISQVSCDQNSSDIFCNNYCSCIDTQTCNNCYNTYLVNCFSNVNSFNQNCFNFFQNYMNNIGPNTDLDKRFYQFCLDKYKNGKLEDKINDPLCACHLDDNVYQDIYQFLQNKFKNVDKVFDKDKIRCVLPQCASSNFPFSSIGKMKCQGVRCLNIVEIDGDNIDFNKITINQSGECINLVGHN